jgi:signal transduction histidine kinase
LPAACTPRNERERLAALATYKILDTPAEPDFDAITQLVAQICETPFAVINLIGEGRQFFKSEVGLGVRETPIATSICAHALLQPGLFVIPDLTADERFADNPLVTAGPGLRFYAGQLLTTDDGFDLGTLCALDTRPRELTPLQQSTLKTLARHVMTLLELRKVSERDRQLIVEQADMNRRLDAALTGHHRMSAMVAHDLRSPLGVVSFGIEMVAAAPDQKLAAVAERMRRAVASMQQLIADLLDLEQASAGALRLERTTVPSAELLRDALDTFAPLAEASGIALRVVSGGDALVHVDRQRIQQVLANLIGNALKVSKRGGAIEIGVTDDAGSVRLFVRDQGPGISPEDQRRVFDPYFTKVVAGAKGTGLGLTISKRIIDASGGRMGIESVPNNGATFWFTLPTTVAIAAAQASS